MDWKQIFDTLISWATTTGVKILIAFVLLIVSFRVITHLTRRLEKRVSNGKHELDKTLTTTLFYLIKIALKTLVVICLIGYLGIDTSGFAALIASLGVGIGLAVNGALSNFAGGALLLITRPFKIDDFIEAQGYSGTVEDIHIISTRIRTPDNKVVYIPNGTLSSGTILNYSEKNTRRVDHKFVISYSDDFEKAKGIIKGIIDSHELILRDPEPFIRISEHGEYGMIITVRVWVSSEDYWIVHFDLLEEVKRSFDNHGIVIPYNQLDVHIKNDN